MPDVDIALISTYPPRGVRHGGASGVASYTSNLAHSLASAGARVTVVAPQVPGEPQHATDGPVAVQRCFRRGPTGLATAAAAALDTGAPVVHLQHEVFLFGGPRTVPGLIPALRRLAREAGLVVTLHQVVDSAAVDRDFTRLHRVRVPAQVARTALRALQNAVQHFAHRVVVHEPAFADVLPGATVIPHGIEELVVPDRSAARRRLDLRDGPLTALCFGFVAPYKGLDIALEAAALAGDRVQLVVAGGEHPRLTGRDPYAPRLEQRWDGAARFTGYVAAEDVSPWFAASDVALYLYPRPFSSSGALALALAHRTPVLLSSALVATTGAPSTLAAPHNPAELASCLQELADRPEQRERLRAAVCAFAQDRSWAEVGRQYLELYEEVTHADRPDGRRLRAGQSW